MWEEKIEKLYKNWISDNELFGVHGERKFLKFVWACIQNEEDAPSQEELKNRIKRDLSKSEDDYKSEITSQAESLYVTLKDYEEIRKEN